MSDATGASSPVRVPEECRTCRFGSGPERDCTLIAGKKLSVLLAEGPCRIESRVTTQVEQVLRAQFPLSASQSEDVAQDAKLRLLQLEDAFPGDKLVRLPALLRWLRRFVKNHVIDCLRKAKVITKIRCGACANFSMGDAGCTLEILEDRGEGQQPNPWAGQRVERATDPRRLEPPCEEFFWRRVGTYDIFEDEVAPRVRAAGRKADAFVILMQALDRLGEVSERGLRAAATVRRHYLGGQTVAEIAKSSSVSEKTVKRLLSAGREGLLDILQRDFKVDSLADLLE